MASWPPRNLEKSPRLGSCSPEAGRLVAAIQATGLDRRNDWAFDEVFTLVFARHDRMWIEYVLIPNLFIGTEMAGGSLGAVGRATMLTFPNVWLLANRRRFIGRTYRPLLSADVFTATSILAFGGYWVP